jgi:hypothetical protein
VTTAWIGIYLTRGPSESATIFGFAGDLGTGAVAVSDGDANEGRWTYLHVPDFRKSN